MTEGMDKWVPVDRRAELMSASELAIARLPVQAQRLFTNDCSIRELNVMDRWFKLHTPGMSVTEARESMRASDLKVLDRVERRFRKLLERHGFDPTNGEPVDADSSVQC